MTLGQAITYIMTLEQQSSHGIVLPNYIELERYVTLDAEGHLSFNQNAKDKRVLYFNQRSIKRDDWKVVTLRTIKKNIKKG